MARKRFDKMNPKEVYENNNDSAQEHEQNQETKKKSSAHTYLFRPAERIKKSEKVYAVGFIDVFVPFLAVFILSVINKFLTSAGAFTGLSEKAFIAIKCLSYLIIFIIPSIVYCKVQKKSLHTSLSLHRFSLSYTPFILIGFLLLVTVIATERIAIEYFFPCTETEQIMYIGREDNKLGIILAYAVFPAICEELFLRGIIQNGISEKSGALTGILVSALTFSLIHLDFKYFIVYFTCGLILAICAHVTNSVIPSAILHIFNNLFSLAFSARLSFIASERTGNSLILIVLVLMVLLIMLFYLKSLENICVKKAYIEDISNEEVPDDGKHAPCTRMSYRTPFRMFASTGYTFHKFLRVVFSPALIVAAIVFLIAAI